jgi:hypothetical protein
MKFIIKLTGLGIHIRASLVTLIFIVALIILPTKAMSQPSFVGMIQFQVQIKEMNTTLIALISSFKKKSNCETTVHGFIRSFIQGNNKVNIRGKVDGVLCAREAPPNSGWQKLLYENSFNHYVFELEKNLRMMIVMDETRMERHYCQLLLNQFVIGKKVSGRCLAPSK